MSVIIRCHYIILVTWEPVAIFDLLIKLKNVAPNWKDLAFYLIKQNDATTRGKLLLTSYRHIDFSI